MWFNQVFTPGLADWRVQFKT